jgi:hypothetical protein
MSLLSGVKVAAVVAVVVAVAVLVVMPAKEVTLLGMCVAYGVFIIAYKQFQNRLNECLLSYYLWRRLLV